MIHIRFALMFVLTLSGCASVSMLGQPMKQITVADSTFRVYMRSGTDMVEAHRISFEPLPSKVLTLTKSVRAIQIATGCELRDGTLRGDQAIIEAEVDCILP